MNVEGYFAVEVFLLRKVELDVVQAVSGRIDLTRGILLQNVSN